MNKVLIIAPNWLGDAVMSLPLLQYLANQPNPLKIGVFANSLTAELYRLSPVVDNIIVGDFIKGKLDIKKRYKLAKNQLAYKNFDQALVLPNSFKSSLIPYFAKIPKRIGYLGEFRYFVLTNIYQRIKNVTQHQAAEYLQLAATNPTEELKKYPPIVDCNLGAQKILGFELDKNHSNVVICPGAQYGRSKRWPSKYFAQVTRYLINRQINVVILGSANDIVTAEEIVQTVDSQQRSKIYNLCGQTSIVDAANILANSKIIISNDSGLMHLSAAVLQKEQKLYAIFGSSSRQKTQPLSKNQSNIEYFELQNLFCRPCYQPTCQYNHYQCLEGVKPEQLITGLEKSLNSLSVNQPI